MNQKLYPYVVFLPSKQKHKILRAIFGSKVAIDIFRFSMGKGISNKIYQKDLVEELAYSNKTVIERLKSLTELGVLDEEMEKRESGGRTVWAKSYQLTDIGKWLVMLQAEEKELTGREKTQILQDIFKAYIKWVKALSKELQVDKTVLEKIFTEEMN